MNVTLTPEPVTYDCAVPREAAEKWLAYLTGDDVGSTDGRLQVVVTIEEYPTYRAVIEIDLLNHEHRWIGEATFDGEARMEAEE